jgi:hypothetical protein
MRRPQEPLAQKRHIPKKHHVSDTATCCHMLGTGLTELCVMHSSAAVLARCAAVQLLLGHFAASCPTCDTGVKVG